jgi:hypothetical protein
MAAEVTAGAASPADTVQRYVDAFNSLDKAGMADCFVESGHILDGMAPHIWSGPRATLDWCEDALAEAEHLGISDFFMTLGTPLHQDVTGNAAYYVAPATLTFKVHGQQTTQSGAIFTVALNRIQDRWLIAAWAWTKGTGGGVGDVSRTA